MAELNLQRSALHASEEPVAVNALPNADIDTDSEYEPPEIMSVDEYDKQFPYQPPRPKASPLRSDDKYGDHASAFNTACQRRGLKAEFDYQEVAQACFNVTLTVNSQIVGQLGPYASKKDAKSAICKRYIADLDNFTGSIKLNSDSSIDKSGARGKLSGPSGEVLDLPDEINDEEWIGIVHWYLQTNRLGHPDFELTCPTANNGPWTCRLRFQGSPSEPFGQSSRCFRRKEEAKKVAAWEAVRWLRQEGKLPPKPPKQTNPPTSSPASGSPQSTQLSSDRPVGQQVDALVRALGFSQPEFRVVNRDGAFVDVWAVFSDRDTRYEPKLAGEVGRVEHVHGKKAAKQECWREVLKVLEEIERVRTKAE